MEENTYTFTDRYMGKTLVEIIKKHAKANWNGWDSQIQCLCGMKLGVQRWAEEWEVYAEHLAEVIRKEWEREERAQG